MFGISGPEFVVVAVIALLVVGPKQLPDVLRVTGRTYRKLNRFVKKTSQLIDDTLYDADRIADKAEKMLTPDQDKTPPKDKADDK